MYVGKRPVRGEKNTRHLVKKYHYKAFGSLEIKQQFSSTFIFLEQPNPTTHIYKPRYK